DHHKSIEAGNYHLPCYFRHLSVYAKSDVCRTCPRTSCLGGILVLRLGLAGAFDLWPLHNPFPNHAGGTRSLRHFRYHLFRISDEGSEVAMRRNRAVENVAKPAALVRAI